MSYVFSHEERIVVHTFQARKTDNIPLSPWSGLVTCSSTGAWLLGSMGGAWGHYAFRSTQTRLELSALRSCLSASTDSLFPMYWLLGDMLCAMYAAGSKQRNGGAL